MRILIVSDAWKPQINGVVRTLESTQKQLQLMGHEVKVIGPDIDSWWTRDLPFYPSIKLEWFSHKRVRSVMESFQPDYIHIATEGPMGWTGRKLCMKMRRPFTTSYHTRYPEYVEARVIPSLRRFARIASYAALRRFHSPSSAIMVATPSIERELRARKFKHIVRWSRGVDMELFKPNDAVKTPSPYNTLPKPILLYVGRVAVEKNIEAFLDADAKGSKVVIGNGPDLEVLKSKYPDAHFLGAMEGAELARHYAAADVFVFPSKTDTFGLVLLEAAASGLRIASYPAPGPIDIFADPTAKNFAVLDADLGKAIKQALALPDDRAVPRRFAEGFSWEASTKQFLEHLQAPTPEAVKRLARFRHHMTRWRRRVLALTFK